MENFLRENVDESSLKLIVDDNESLTINVNDDPDDMYNYQDFNIDNYENYEKILIYEFKKYFYVYILKLFLRLQIMC